MLQNGDAIFMKVPWVLLTCHHLLYLHIKYLRLYETVSAYRFGLRKEFFLLS